MLPPRLIDMAVYLAAASLIFAVNRDERHEFLLFVLAFVLGILGAYSGGPGGAMFILAMLLACAASVDVSERLIPNRLVFPAVLLGLLENTLGRPGGLVFSLAGMAVGFGVMFCLFLFGAVGGGDVKLAAAVGAVAGPWFAVGAVAWAVLFSSVSGVAFMAVRGRLIELLRYTWLYFKYLLYKIARRDFSSEPPARADFEFPFAVFIMLGCMTEILFPGVMYRWLTVFSNALSAISGAL
ncbi:prepilin peptidase [Desulfofundulus sp. TPOSR]|uniref:A24 family peptidase n=1 Tax=Desulfofundulus sp. TPOSR TaxID=2714340 RepID=UPI0014087EE4|nr:A24 family peptidase [Desulfofundulus sp. TPOSR]NHM28973.1 prepilin peptidase [Desulfofundulus sp. TPOSR]